MSLISGATQPVQELRLVGHVRDGLCRAAFKGVFENKRDHPLEISFSFPLPARAYPSDFKVRYNGQKVTSRIALDDRSRLAFDDAIAQSDFAAMARLDGNHEVTIEIGAIAPGDRCNISVYFELPLSPLPNGFFLAIPTSIPSFSENLRLGYAPPPLRLQFDVRDSLPIKALTTPFTDNARINLNTGTITSPSLSIFHPFHLVVSFPSKLLGRCLYQNTPDATFIQVVGTTPRAVRDHASQFTVVIEQGPQFTGSQVSVILRAIEFFILSIPNGSKFNLCYFGYNSLKLFDVPMPLDEANRNRALSITRQTDQTQQPVPATFEEVQQTLLSKIPLDTESVVMVIASKFADDVQLSPYHRFFFVDPFSRGNMQQSAQGAVYVTVGCEAGLISALLNVIKMTASESPMDMRLSVSDQIIRLPSRMPSEQFSTFLKVDRGECRDIHFICQTLRTPLRAVEAPLPILPHLFRGGPIESGESAVVIIERDSEIDGDVTHIESRLSQMGIGWVASPKELVAVPGPIRQQFRRPVRDIRTEVRMPIAEVASPATFKGGRKPFFLLRLLQLQNPDGSWSLEKNLAACCGFQIPQGPKAIGRLPFLTAFVIVCLRLKARDDEDKWDLVAEKGLTYLTNQYPKVDWEEQMKQIQTTLVQ